MRESKPFEMRLQVSCGVHHRMPEASIVGEDTEVFGDGISRIGRAEEESDRSRASADQYTVEICGIDNRG